MRGSRDCKRWSRGGQTWLPSPILFPFKALWLSMERVAKRRKRRNWLDNEDKEWTWMFEMNWRENYRHWSRTRQPPQHESSDSTTQTDDNSSITSGANSVTSNSSAFRGNDLGWPKSGPFVERVLPMRRISFLQCHHYRNELNTPSCLTLIYRTTVSHNLVSHHYHCMWIRETTYFTCLFYSGALSLL